MQIQKTPGLLILNVQASTLNPELASLHFSKYVPVQGSTYIGLNHRLHIQACCTRIQSKHAMHRKKYLGHRVLLHIREAEKFLGSYIKIPKSEQALHSHLSLPLLNPFKRLKREITSALKVYTTSPKQFCTISERRKSQGGILTESYILPILGFIQGRQSVSVTIFNKLDTSFQ